MLAIIGGGGGGGSGVFAKNKKSAFKWQSKQIFMQFDFFFLIYLKIKKNNKKTQ